MKKNNIIIAILGLIFWSCEQKQTEISKPEPNRFSKQIIKSNLTEPIALAISNTGDVYFCQRKGEIFIYKPKSGLYKKISTFLVDEYAGNGIMGLTLDPNFDYNKRIYVFYIDTSSNYKLSRFKIEEDTIFKSKEELIFSFPIDHEPGAHNGGTILFDKEGNLLISTGDNTPPWQGNGYPPHEQIEGREMYDALRTAANTNDFRGKILRIKPLDNGKYVIPEGNLFPKNGSQGKPEIYVMGCRNPWRMSIDNKTGYVYWGEVGPDAGLDSTIGPRGYDEINQARNAGNFGWPMFIADNKPYSFVHLLENSPGEKFDITNSINPSKNNTGLKRLPPPQKALIYYPYSESKEFPLVGKAGRTACAGPVYDFMKSKNSTVKFPKYYHDKLFIYEWMRDWVMAVTLDKNGNYKSMEKVLENTPFVHPTHMAFAPDGSLYVIEYGMIWYAQNKEASLSRIIFSEGNRPPVANITCKDTIASTGTKIIFNANKSFDYDGDSILYEWSINNEKSFSNKKSSAYLFSTPGIYMLQLKCQDSKNFTSSITKKIIIGNTYPKLKINIKGNNKSFYFTNNLNYFIEVFDSEDKTIDSSKIESNITYIPQGNDIYPMLTNHSEAPIERQITENKLIAASDCKNCHAMSKKSVGPSFIEISKKYSNDASSINVLVSKIIKGGAGVWGEHAMSAHPQISQNDAKSMVEYIFSLSETLQSNIGKYSKNIKPKGVISAEEFNNKTGWFYITSTYSDKGFEGKNSLIKTETYILKNPSIKCIDSDTMHSCTTIEQQFPKKKYVGGFNENSYLVFKNIDLSSLTSVSIKVNSKFANGVLQIRKNSPKGEIWAQAKITPQKEWDLWETVIVPTVLATETCDLYLMFDKAITTNDSFEYNMINLDYIKFNNLELVKSK